MYTGYELINNSRNLLTEVFPPKYPTFLGHHITETFGVSSDYPPPPYPHEVKVIGYLDDGEGVEGLLVSVDGNVNRPKGGKYHITWSIDKSKGKKPVDTNNLVDEPEMLTKPIQIEVIPKTFTKSTEQSLKRK